MLAARRYLSRVRKIRRVMGRVGMGLGLSLSVCLLALGAAPPTGLGPHIPRPAFAANRCSPAWWRTDARARSPCGYGRLLSSCGALPLPAPDTLQSRGQRQRDRGRLTGNQLHARTLEALGVEHRAGMLALGIDLDGPLRSACRPAGPCLRLHRTWSLSATDGGDPAALRCYWCGCLRGAPGTADPDPRHDREGMTLMSEKLEPVPNEHCQPGTGIVMLRKRPSGKKG